VEDERVPGEGGLKPAKFFECQEDGEG
jgi:hypothetical protein